MGNDNSGEAVGEYLRRNRQERGFSIEQIAGLTRVSPRYIQALEEGRLADFPSEVIARGFVRLCARSIGLDEQDVIRRFSKEADAFFRKKDDRKQETQRKTERTEKRKKRFGLLAQVFLIVAFGLAIVLVYGINSSRLDLNRFFRSSAPSTRISAPNIPRDLDRGTESTVLPASPSSPMESGPMPEPDRGRLSEMPAPTTPLVSEPNAGEGGGSKLPLTVNIPGHLSEPILRSVPLEKMTLHIEAVEDSWVLAEIDNGISKEILLRAGESVAWEASEQFLMSFGNAGGVLVRLDGEALPVMGPSGAVVKNVLITRESHR